MTSLLLFVLVLVVLLIGGLVWDAQGREDSTAQEPPAFDVEIICPQCGRHLMGPPLGVDGRDTPKLFEICERCQKTTTTTTI